MRHVHIGSYLKVTLAYKVFKGKFSVNIFSEIIPVLRHVQIGRYLKVTLAYRVLKS